MVLRASNKKSRYFVANLRLDYFRIICANFLELREAPRKKIYVQTVFCQIAFQPPPSQANGRFVAGIFRRKLANSSKQRF